MEDASRGRSGHGGEVKEKIGAAAAGGGDEGFCIGEVIKANQDQKSSSLPERKESSLNKKLEYSSTMDPGSKAPSSSQKEQDDQHESAKAEMCQVIEENQRLKLYLDRMMKDYKSLQMQFYHAIHQEEIAKGSSAKTLDSSHQAVDEESELVSLSLGRFSSEPKRLDREAKTSSHDQDDHAKQGLSLTLDCKFEAPSSPDCADHETFQNGLEEAGEACLRSKALKTMRNGGDDEVPQQNPAKKVRVSVRAKCDTPTMNDGCQWRKYGQKISKGNPCPRAYYRCTISPSCPVRKQVQRCADDMSILISTYEGTHNHPLPMSATVMASTTSAAASMPLSGSSSSSSPPSPAPYSTKITSAADLHGLSFYLLSSDNSKPKQYLVHNPSLISSSPSCPTITLDLASAPSSSSSSFHPLNRFSSTYSTLPKFASTGLNFGSSSEPNTMPWGNGILNRGSSSTTTNTSTSQAYKINSQLGTSLNLGRPPIDNNIDHSCIQKNINIQADPSQQYPVLPDTIAVATKAITNDPNFQYALVAALTSMISPGNLDSQSANRVGGDNFVQKWGDNFPAVKGSNNNDSATTKENGYATNYLNKTTSSTSSQAGSLMFLPPSLSFSSPESASTSLGEKRDHVD